jgi:hypothetical protein
MIIYVIFGGVLATLAVTVTAITLMFPKPLPRTLLDTHKTKPKVHSRKDLREMERGNYVNVGKDSVTGQPFILSERARTSNVLNFGPTGSGKSWLYLDRFYSADIARKDNALVIFDPQADVTDEILALCAQAGRNCIVYPGQGFNPLRGGPGSASHRANIFANVLGQVLEVSADGMYYVRRTQSFIRHLVPLYERAESQPMIIRELYLLAQDKSLCERLAARAAGSPEAAEYRATVGRWSEADFKHDLTGLCSVIEELSLGSRGYFYNQRFAPSLSEAIEAKSVIIIREGNTEHTPGRTAGLFFMAILQDYIIHRPKNSANHFIVVYIDEAHFYLNPGFRSFISTNRKKNTALHLAFQTLEQTEPYRTTITGGAKTWLVHGGLQYEDARVVADNIGRRLYSFKSTSRSALSMAEGESDSPQYDYLMQPSEIRDLPWDRVLVLETSGGETQALRTLIKEPWRPTESITYEEPSLPENFVFPPAAWEEEQADIAGARPPRGINLVKGDDFPDADESSFEAADRAANW